jgi:hypothetical protein
MIRKSCYGFGQCCSELEHQTEAESGIFDPLNRFDNGSQQVKLGHIVHYPTGITTRQLCKYPRTLTRLRIFSKSYHEKPCRPELL